MSYRILSWDDEDARLKTFSATTKADASSVVKIEIEVRDPYRLGRLLQDLGEIRREQAAASRAPAPAPKPTASRRRAIASQKPLLLTYRED